MRFVVPVVLMLVALIHLLPLAGMLGAGRLSALYGVEIRDPNLEIMMRHRAVLFALLAAFLGHAALRPELHRLGLVAALVSVLSFLVLARLVSGYNGALGRVVGVDLLALGLLCVAGLVHLLPGSGAAELGR